ncbi:MAG: hypothetical protein ACK5QC_02565 [Bacteroidota bacterium]
MKNFTNGFGSPRLWAKSGHSMPLKYFTFILLFGSCGHAYQEKNNSEENAVQKSKTTLFADSLSTFETKPITDTINGIGYNFIKKATLKCKVNHVLKTTERIEDIITLNGGYVTFNDYNSDNCYTSEIRHQRDSLLKITHYTPQCTLSARVPTKLLDSVIRKIVALAEYIDTKKLSADNVRLKLMANQLFVKRKLTTIKQTQIAEKSIATRFKDKERAINSESENRSLADERQLNNLELIDQVNYSEINLMLYQDMALFTKTIAKPDIIKPYQTPFLNRLGDGILNGLKILSEIIIALINCWGIIALCVALYFGIKHFYQRSTKKVLH